MKDKTFKFDKACKMVGIKVICSENSLTIKTLFNPLNKFGFGSLLFLVCGIFFGVLTISKTDNLFLLIVGCVIGFGLSTIATLSILSDVTSYCTIADNCLEIRNRLKRSKVSLYGDCQVKVKTYTEYVKMNSQAGSGSYFRNVDLYVCDEKKEHLIIDFQTDDKHRDIADRLGKELAVLVEERIKSF